MAERLDKVAQVTLVCGPACSGKSTYVREHADPGDLVIDWDDIAVRMGSPRTHLHPKWMLDAIAAEYDRQLERVPDWPGRVWIIRGLPDTSERAAWADRFDADVVVLAPDLATLDRRAEMRWNPSLTRWSIRRWFERAGS